MVHEKTFERADGTRYKITVGLYNEKDIKENRYIFIPEFSVQKALPGTGKFEHVFEIYTQELARLSIHERNDKKRAYNLTLVTVEEVKEVIHEMFLQVANRI